MELTDYVIIFSMPFIQRSDKRLREAFIWLIVVHSNP